MTITSKGYGGTIGEADLPLWHQSFAGDYGVIDPGDCYVGTVVGVDRTVTVAAGTMFGKLIRDVNSAPFTIQLPTLASGTRYDLIVAHRDSSGTGGTTTLTYIEGRGTPTGVFASRKTFEVDVTQDDQPLAIAKITGNGGGGVLAGVTDLRCWVGTSGAVARDVLALQYLSAIGTQVRIGDDIWTRVLDANLGATWSRSTVTAINLLGFGAALAGTPAADTQFQVQVGTWVATTDASGFAALVFPVPFPNGLLACFVSNGDGNYPAVPLTMAGAGGSWGIGTPTKYVYSVKTPTGPAPGMNHRVNYIAIGW